MGKAQSILGILTEKLKFKPRNEYSRDDFQEEDGNPNDDGPYDSCNKKDEACLFYVITEDGNPKDDGPYDSCNKKDEASLFYVITEDGNPKEEGPYDSCNKKNEASLFYGTHETQVSKDGEADLLKHFDNCTEKQGHTEFVSANDFNINDLPKGYHDNNLLKFIKATADLTVRLAVKMTSTERPEFWPNTNQPYPFYDKRESDITRLGTGMVWYINKQDKNRTCRCHKCQHSDTPSKVWKQVVMCTARHVVFDGAEARFTTCRLFYDRQDSPLVTLDGWTVTKTDREGDWCWLSCATCDLDLLDKLHKMVGHWEDLWEKVNDKYERSRDKHNLTFIVSHPHGCPKQVSVGHWTKRHVVDDFNCTKYTYTCTCTCPGSSGAYAHSLGYDDWCYDRHVHSGVSSEGNNFRATGWDFPLISLRMFVRQQHLPHHLYALNTTPHKHPHIQYGHPHLSHVLVKY